MAQTLNQVPPNLLVWEVLGQTYLVRLDERQQPPVPMVWLVSTPADREALGITGVDRRFGSWDEFNRTGALRFGDSRELANTTVDPVDAIFSNYETEVRVKPWLGDAEIFTLWMAAAMEGRGINEAELQGTAWWWTHTQAERQWLSLNASDPATANQLISDQRLRIADLFAQAGIDNASGGLVELVADKWTQGAWSETYALSQIRLLADPYLGGTLDSALTNFRTGLDTNRAREDEATALINTWLGPAYSSRWGQESIASWASRLRENPDDTRVELTEILKQHRLALFPEYTNPNLTYEDIAAPWRGVWSGEWGETPDESDPLFAQVVRTNQIAAATKLLRSEGLKRNNPTVVNKLVADIGGAFGGQVRRADPAIQ